MSSKDRNKKTPNTGSRRRRWLWVPLIAVLAAFVLMGGFLAYLTVTEYRPAFSEPALGGGAGSGQMIDGDRVRILSFNIGYASLGKEADFLMDGGEGSGQTDRETVERNLAGISGLLEQNEADLYMLQEIDRKSDRTYDLDFLERLETPLEGYSWHYAPNFLCGFVPYPLPDPFGAIDSGIATYSRYDVSEALRISLPNSFSWPIRTANLKRCMLVTRLPIADSEAELVVINFHLEAYDDGEGKQAQTMLLLELMEQEYEKGNYVVAGGDFNQMFPGVDTVVKPTSEWVPGRLEPLPAGWEDWQFVYDDSVPTCRLLNEPYDPGSPLTQYYVIDGFLVSPNVEAVGIQTIDADFSFSDHNPVVMDFKLR